LGIQNNTFNGFALFDSETRKHLHQTMEVISQFRYCNITGNTRSQHYSIIRNDIRK